MGLLRLLRILPTRGTRVQGSCTLQQLLRTMSSAGLRLASGWHTLPGVSVRSV